MIGVVRIGKKEIVGAVGLFAGDGTVFDPVLKAAGDLFEGQLGPGLKIVHRARQDIAVVDLGENVGAYHGDDPEDDDHHDEFDHRESVTQPSHW